MSKVSNVKPLGDRVLIEAELPEEMTKTGIILPDTAKEKPQSGTVVAVGEGSRAMDGSLIPMTVKVGDKVLFSKYGGSEIKIDGEEYLVVKESDILVIRS